VALDRRALSPSASSRLLLFAERPRGTDLGDFQLEESGDGVTFAPVAGATARALDGAIEWETAMPLGPRWFRVAAPYRSNDVAVGIAGAPVQPIAVVSPAAGGTGVPRTPAITVSGGAGVSGFVFAIADRTGTIVRLASSGRPSVAFDGGTTFVDAARLAGGEGHVATAVALDGSGFGAVVAPRIDFVTAP
jgi:hypothetical protein